MADLYASNWDETDANNTTAAPDGMPEGMAPSGVNNWGRAVAGAVKRYVNQNIPKTTGGTTTAYTLSYGVAPGALVDGMTHLVNFNATCGASPTLNVNSLGAKPIHYFNGSAWAVVPSGMIKSDMTLEVAYNSSAGTYRIVSAAAPVVAQSTAGSSGYTTLPGPAPLLIQWGSATVAGSATTSITFTVAYSAAPPLVLVGAGGSNTAPGYAASPGTTGFSLANPGSQTIVFYWMAIGLA